MTGHISIGRSTGHVDLVPPYQHHQAETKRCAWQDVTLAVKREGRTKVIAVYRALPQGNLWSFVVDDALRNAKPGWYIGTVYCCRKPMHSIRMRLLLPEFGAASAVDAERDMCDDWTDNNCPPTVVPRPTRKPAPPCYTRVECGTT